MTTAETPVAFDICGPLPAGVTVLEASAGTGKTYTIAALAARYVAEGVALDALLLITFTRMATGELRDRVRERLVDTEQQLTRILAGEPDPGDDQIVTLLADGPREEVGCRRDRLARAVANFDGATIATTHSFCQEVLAELGTVGDLEPGTQFVEDVSDLVDEVVDDFYVRGFRGGKLDPLPLGQIREIARAAVFKPEAALAPAGEPPGSPAAIRYRIADAVRREVEERKRRLAIMTYDDLLTRLKNTLDGDRGHLARSRLRDRFQVVLVDEFQDTDPIQWQILQRAFQAEGITLVLVADPKQAIYAFRGADVYAYLVASQTADVRATLQVNRRSDQPLLDAYDALFDGAQLGEQGIDYRTVQAAPEHDTSRLIGAPEPAPLRVRVVHRDEPSVEKTAYGYVITGPARRHIAEDLAADIVRLLSSGARLSRPAAEGPGEDELVRPGHIAVLVRRNTDALDIRDELQARRVPAVINGAGSVFTTPSAGDWLRLLEALERPASAAKAHAVALTPFFGWDAKQVGTTGEEDWETVHQRLHRWGRILRDAGVAALTDTIMREEGLPARMLTINDGERRLTDLRHLAQLLHRAASTERLGVTALRGWLAERLSEAGEEAEEERTRRLDSDAEAVQVLTIHRSKGLEFPIIYCPSLWEASYIPEGQPVDFHDPAAGERRTLDVGLDNQSFASHANRHLIEQRGEDLRLAYVALTRAKHQAVMWWVPTSPAREGPLTRLLFSRNADGTIQAKGERTPGDEAVDKRFAELAVQAPGRISIERSTLGLRADWSPPFKPAADLEAARFDRHLDLRWRRTSYSDITAEAHDALVSSEPEERGVVDEPSAPVPAPALVAESASGQLSMGVGAPVSPWSALPAGADFGTFVHRVFEASDFAAPDLAAELEDRVTALATRRALGEASSTEAVAALVGTIETPLGAIADGLRLRDVSRADRLDELAFELPLAGGDDPTGGLTLRAIASTLREQLPADDPLAAYAARLEDPALRSSVRGFLTGSIDLVLRLPGPRFAIIDYKTNWLGPPTEPLSLDAYRPPALTAEMSRAHYGLQALLYAVALHRYLRWRMPGYAPEQHLAGVLYLFVRGLAGPTTPTLDGAPYGVFGWRPPGAAIAALSDVLDRGVTS